MTATPTLPTQYVPGHGDWTYGVESYRVDLKYKVTTNRLDAKANLAVVAHEETQKIALDLAGLQVSKVKVAGTPAKYQHRGRKLTVQLAQPLQAGARCSIEITYAGKPRPIPGPDGTVGWEELEDGSFVLSQPHGAPSWLPCNDRPSDKAIYTITVTADKAYYVAANGVLVAKNSRKGLTTWTYAQDSPMSTYLATVQIGRYQVQRFDSPIALSVAAPKGTKVGSGTSFARQAKMLTFFEELFGPYPFRSYQVIITDDELEIPLEAQGICTFGRNHLATGWANERLVAHELSHQWFGNSLTLKHWHDIWLHEGFACYSEWLWSEGSGREPVSHHVNFHYQRLAKLPQDLVLSAPGRRAMFDDRVYKRGALTVHAIRQVLGDEAFFAMLRQWTQNYTHGNIDTNMFLRHVQEYTTESIRDVVHPWLHDRELPPIPVVQ